MWAEINLNLKQKLPSVHARLKRWTAPWRGARAPLVPALKCVRGDFFWVHPRVLTVDVRDCEPHIWRWISGCLRPDSVFLDIGAHFGWLSLKASRQVGPAGRVVAFEPSPALLEILRYHQRLNRLPQMTVIGSALSDADAIHAPFYLLNRGFSFRNSLTIGRSGLPFLDGVAKTCVDVPTQMLDSFCRDEGLIPDVIKIDVEGAEFMVLRGATATLREHHPVVILSTHPYWLPPSQSAGQILEFLEGFGYRVRDSHEVRAEGHDASDYLLSA